MDFAVTTILLVMLLLPGLVFRRFYYTEEFSKEYFKESLPAFFLSTALPSAIIHLVAWQVVTGWYDLSISTFSILFSGTDDPKHLQEAFLKVHVRLFEIAGYFTFLAGLSALLGRLCKSVVRRNKWDRKFKLLRFRNEWHYLFSGEIMDFPRIRGKAADRNLTYVDALVHTDEGTVIYKGVLEDYVLTKDGGVDRIYISETRRRFLKDDGKTDTERTIPGQFLMLPFSTIINLHLTYYAVDISQQRKQEAEAIVKKDDAEAATENEKPAA